MNKQLPKAIQTKKSPTLDSFSGLFLPVLVLGMFLATQGHCADPTQDLEAMTTNVMNTIFSPWVKKGALAFGFGGGIFKAIASGSPMPFLVYGGIGLAVNFIPSIVELISKM